MEPTEVKATFKELTKYINGVFILLLIVSAYVIQRSYMAIPLAEAVSSEFVDQAESSQQQPQVGASGLSFTYGAMNIFWPIVIFAFLFLLVQMTIKHVYLWQILVGGGTSATTFDSLNLYQEVQSALLGKILLVVSCFLPLFAIILHGISGYWIFSIISTEQIHAVESQELLIWQFYLQLLVTVVSLGLSIMLPFRLVKMIKTFKV
ncbi:hypothetical protein [Chryseolinea lacunae]|uniref:Uncharacterized protein n=1 Tax=Chryseolinea lacunae TaxID=2801331 RepID=A0ABS1L2M4_9BACT|nr:hypothetical protein [Chryseolinea lacunae]MBL0745944.1 hypothetical protein [Chryseolinea lacunae]